ncbi:hypothetical protein CPHO_08385 [Corynebacterium phocae]|uniref:CRISPR-associated protein n=1 Tax=Corynebacterium phocae TaxID=161895 RepID=A0A1L7D4G3_9CORY|nr:hypothetical protein [Corynebacterium phocae]APT92901.1 hypothetical protein CPHO_08385 [Corynebacterium phocae]KAA8723224.1 hypothetical protein F4V58_07880 [Corynebacterium phocae]
MTSLTVTAHLDSPIIGDLGPLDSVLAWACHQEATRAGQEVPPITPEHCHDFDLPLEKWEIGGYWGWCTSAPLDTPHHYSSVEIRRRPAATAMSIYTSDREHHNGLGPTKARNVTLSAQHYPSVSWHVEATDHGRLQALLGYVTHLGARHRNGFGHITQWETQLGPKGGWIKRPLPARHGTTRRVRAPYWHPTERTPCT